MTRKLRRNYSLSVVVPFIAVLIVSVAFVTLAQTPGASQRSAQQAVVSAQQDSDARAHAPQPPLWFSARNAGRSPVTTNEPGAVPMDGNPLPFFFTATYNAGADPDSVVVADVNGDGHPDLVVGDRCARFWDECGYGSNAAVSVMLGNGDGTFQFPVSYNSGGTGALSVAVADLNGDGRLDIVVANVEGVGVLLGNGDGTFQPAVSYSSGGFVAVSVAIGDVNGDGHPDLVVANEFQCDNCDYGSVSVLLANGDGTFQPAISYNSGGFEAASVAIGDVNGDGHLDLDRGQRVREP